jgi:hypothetical protein
VDVFDPASTRVPVAGIALPFYVYEKLKYKEEIIGPLKFRDSVGYPVTE